MILKDKKIVFIHIPRCAGVSTERFFGWHGLRHETMQTYANEYGFNYLDSCFKFTFIRNPWDRMVSWYFKHKNNKLYEPKTPEAFTKWIKGGMPNHWERNVNEVDKTNWAGKDALSCLDFLNNDQNINIDYIGKVETINKDMEYICNKANIEYKELPHVNKSDHKHYREYYNEETENIVRKRFKRDLLFFPYEF
tara:strand:+ start:914 stop:1495 length:582 start_codon:yes stop_codon:yes gene_type:complete